MESGEQLKQLVARAFGDSSASPSLHKGQAEAMKMVDLAISECSQRPDAVQLASHWVESACVNSDPYLLWAAGAILEVVASSSKLWLRNDPKHRNHCCNTLLRASAKAEVLKANPWISAKVQRALSSAVIHEWPDNFPEFSPTVNQGFLELQSVLIQLSTVVLNRAAEIAVSKRSTSSFRKFGSLLMSNREKLQSGLKDIVPFLFQSANSALARCSGILAGNASGGVSYDDFGNTCKAVLEVLSESVKIAEENAIKLQVETSMIQILFNLSKSFMNEKSLACKALECIAEVTSQSSISLDDESYFKVILQELIALVNYCRQNVDEELAKILINISCILIGKHITRLEMSPGMKDSLVQLLSELFQLSFDANNPQILLQSLDVWEIVLEHVESEHDVTYSKLVPNGTSSNEIYMNLNLSVADRILRRLFLYTQEGQSILCKLDSTPGSAFESLSEIQLQEHAQGRDVSEFSELDHYHSRCEEIFGLLLDIYPDYLLPICITSFKELNGTYGSILADGASVFKCGSNITTVSHDMSTCLRLITRCAPKFTSIDPDTTELVYNFVISIASHILCVYDSATQVNVPQSEAEEIARYADINGKLAYNCLSMFSMWIRFLGASNAGDRMERIVKAYLDISIKAFETSAANKAISENVLISAAGALSSFSTVVQPSIAQMQGIQSFQTLLGLLQTIMKSSPQRATSSIWVFLSDSLFKKIDPKQNELEHLTNIEAEFTRLVSMPAESLVRASAAGDQSGMEAIQSAAHTLSALTRAFGGKSHSARMLLSKTMSGVLPPCMNIIKALSQNPGIDQTGKVAQNVIQLLISCFDVISKEMGDDLITSIVKEFIDLYSNPNAMRSLSVDTGASLMELLTLLARRPGSKFKALSLQTLEFCIGIWPKLTGQNGVSHSDVLQLLLKILRYQWRGMGESHVQGVMNLLLELLLKPDLVQRCIAEELIKLDEQTKVFSSRSFGLDQNKVFALVCALMQLLELRLDLQEVILGVLYRISNIHVQVLQMALQQKASSATHQDTPMLLQKFYSKSPNNCAEFSSNLLHLINDVAFLSSL